MKLLEQRIQKDGRVLGDDILKVDTFLNHQVDPELMQDLGEAFAQAFAKYKIDKVVTVESSGIAPALFTGLALHVPVIFARKNKSLTLPDDVYTADVYSFTKQTTNHIMIDHRFLNRGENILLIDDFLANGQAISGLLDISHQAGTYVVGVGIVIEKAFQKGRAILDAQGIDVVSLARISNFENGQVVFATE
ncbi:xanthine phosphoribosyltransferase [Leuconostoc fallax]|uniref:Xanthine phosphoribosyltransferase n=1 Tax=Leuconostoc fallax TaxID=1251 RepID=A0A4V3A2S8_9LACO|nr:xanthine phosphoribosyltransferase [Leuconostoc fallax]MBU7456099.1 xanthine phosphoribosyltransferase [Leuconostoc fallax]TDG70104.1 hypothetical protein C5L23_001628 [Leuconostoc fallax]